MATLDGKSRTLLAGNSLDVMQGIDSVCVDLI